MQSIPLCLPLLAGVVSLSASLATAQATLLVGPGGYAQIRDAIAAAAPGDLLLVQPGTYAHFVIEKELTIMATSPGTVAIAYDAAFAAPGCPGFLCSDDATTFRLPSGATTNVIGLSFVDNTFSTPNGTASHRVIIDEGRATFDQCTFSSQREAALAVRFGATAHLQDCALTATGGDAAAMLVAGGTVTAIDSFFYGSSAATLAPRAAVQLQLGVLRGSNLELIGGSNGGRAMQAQGWFSLCDSVLTANLCPIDTGGVGSLDRCQLTGGAGCPNYSGTWQLGVHRPSPLQTGSPFALEFRSEPNGLVAVFASPRPATIYTSLLDPAVWLDPNGLVAAALLVANAQGDATVSWPIPSGPGMRGLSLWFQGVSGLTFPLRASAPAGGVAR